MRNVQQRRIAAPMPVVGRLLEQITDPQASTWPTAWPPLVLDRALTPGSTGGHGPIRYTVSEVEPGRRVRFEFGSSCGIVGHHEFVVVADGADAVVVTHLIAGRTRGRMLLEWPLVVRWLHEALISDLFDTMERAATGTLHGEVARWSLWVRFLRDKLGRRSSYPSEPVPDAG